MCGIAGLIDPGRSADALERDARAMADAIIHRGPDDAGVWTQPQTGVALAHRRLSIIDTSSHGHQPMQSASGRYVLCYNGEIYNFRDLRAELNYPWQSESDTEVLLAAIEHWGLEKALERCHGMFAFALWDNENKSLSLARDRIGEKPLYYGMADGAFLFASELKSLHALTGFAPAINRDALTQLIGYSYIASPHSIYEGIHKLEPGYMAQFKDGVLSKKPFWTLIETMQAAQRQPLPEDESACVDALEQVLSKSVKQQMVADVPLGAFLSGGVDSSAIVALMQAQSSRPVKTFSIGFGEPRFNEAPYAKAVAEHLGTEHTEMYVSAEEARAVIPQLADIYDEPFGDSSQIPTYLVSKLAREHVTVSLSGDAGDELFGGYTRYLRGPKLWDMVKWMPAQLRHTAVYGGLKPLQYAMRMVSSGHNSITAKIGNYSTKLLADNPQEFYELLCRLTNEPEAFLVDGKAYAQPNPFNDLPLSYSEWMMAQDIVNYLTGDILTKVDRAAMAVSLETRMPLLDPDVVAFSCRTPLHMKIRDGQSKWLLRQVLYRHVPRPLIERPKAGFAIPLAEWLSGPLKDWANDLLNPETLRRQGYFRADKISAAWQEHLKGSRDHSGALWNVLMFQSWYDRYHG